MAYEVVKTVRGKRYRYRVESYRDETTGKPRGKWTYLGPAEPDEAAPASPPAGRTSATRGRILAALERLLEREEYGRVTAAAVAREADLGHGTFYLHFKDVREALRAALKSVGEEVSTMLDTSAPVTTREHERAKIADWLGALLDATVTKPGLFRAFNAVLAQDEEVAAQRRIKHGTWVQKFSGYLGALDKAGIAHVENPEALAWMILAIIDGVLKMLFLHGTTIEGPLRTYVKQTIDRAIFEPAA